MSEENNELQDLEDLTFAQIIEADDIEMRRVPVPEWGGAIYMKSMTGQDRDNYIGLVQARMVGSGDDRKISDYSGLSSHLLQKCMAKKDGSPLFSPAQVRDLQKKNSGVLNRLQTIAQEMNGLTDEEVEKYAGNLKKIPSSDDGTTSPDGSDAPTPKQNGG